MIRKTPFVVGPNTPEVTRFGGRFARIALGKGGSILNATHNHKESSCFANSFIRLAICGLWQERYSYIADSAWSAGEHAGADANAGANPDSRTAK